MNWKIRAAGVALAELPLTGLATVTIHAFGNDWLASLGFAVLGMYALNLVIDVRAWDRDARQRERVTKVLLRSRLTVEGPLGRREAQP